MTPKTLEERMATVEAEYGHLREALHDETKELRSTNALLREIPGLIGRRIRRHARHCAGNPEAPRDPTPRPPAPPAPDPDWGWVRKAMAGLLILGSLIGGAIWGPRQIDVDPRAAIAAPAAPVPPSTTTGGNP